MAAAGRCSGLFLGGFMASGAKNQLPLVNLNDLGAPTLTKDPFRIALLDNWRRPCITEDMVKAEARRAKQTAECLPRAPVCRREISPEW